VWTVLVFVQNTLKKNMCYLASWTILVEVFARHEFHAISFALHGYNNIYILLSVTIQNTDGYTTGVKNVITCSRIYSLGTKLK
jgi:hypothetical protein